MNSTRRTAQINTVRARVLARLQQAPGAMTGQAIAQALGLPYKPVVDALVALNNQGKVWRIGRKFTAQWTAHPPPSEQERALTHLDRLFRP